MADSKRIYIVAPGGFRSGGPELMHQLCHSLRERGLDAAIVYTPFFRMFEVPDRFSNYDIRVARSSEIASGDTVVLPEVFSAYIPRFKRQRVLFWWMSVDFYLASDKWTYALRSGMLPWKYHRIDKKPFPTFVEKHLVQSEYARLFLAKHGVVNVEHLGDYLNKDYLALANSSIEGREDIVAYNPSKGIEFTQKIIAATPDVDFVPIVNMSRDEVIALLLRAKVYVDFGNHPGKDRIPREAAILGCCIITNRRGSAANERDVPIDRKYKIDDANSEYPAQAAEIIRATFANFGKATQDFMSYRDSILREPDGFDEDVDRIFGRM